VHLKSLRIQGFKTFARRTELPFSRGITAIVGPNGSGKSNLVDAIRWGLGERNARGLRGQRMEDVIYSGGPGKSAVGMAEVSLTIDNADQRLNVEFTEIEVARRLFRSGESDYLINGTRARLKDIDLLLASTGLRQDGYAVTAQNDIDYVIQAAPGLRRELIEEAAGVRRLRDQRQEALNRLAEAERDMRRARDILAELTPRAAELETQARAAEEYQRVADQLRTLQGSLARDAWRKAMVLLRRAHSRRQSTEQKRSIAAQAIDEFAPRYAQDRAALLEAREARWKHQEAVAGLRLQLAEREHQARIAEERAAAATHALAVAEEEMLRLAATAQAGVRVVEELEQAAARTEEELTGLQASVTTAVADERTARDLLETLEQDRAALAQQRQDLHRDAVATDAELRQVEGRLQFLTEQREQADAHLESWSARQATAVQEVSRCELRATDADGTWRSAVSTVEAIEEQLRNVLTELSQSETRLAELSGRVGALEAEVGALERLRDGAMPRSRLADDERLQQLLELIEVAEEDRPAIEAALEGWLHAWVPADREAAERAFAVLAQPRSPRETIVYEPDNPLTAPESGLVGVATLVTAPAHIAGLLRHLLDRTVLVANAAEGRNLVLRHPSYRAVTRAGEVITAASYRGGAFRDAPLEVQAQVRLAQTSLARARAGRADAATALDAVSRRRAVLQEERAAAAATFDAARGQVTETAGAVSMARAALAREDQQESQVRAQIARLDSLLEQAHAGERLVVERQDQVAASQVALTAAVAQIEERVQLAATGLSVKLHRRQEVELRAALAQQRHEDLIRQLERAREVWRGHGDELAQRQAATRELSTQPGALEEERRHCLEFASTLAAELATLEAANLPDADLLASLEAQVQAGEQRNVQLQVELAHADDGVAAALMDVESAQVEVDRCALALREDGQVVEEDEPIAEVDWQKTEREVSRLQRRLDGMGAVNLLAPEEFAQVRERCDGLGSQLADLETASAQLLELRQRLENEIDERFRTVFHSVAINFQEFFAELFEGGGKATLRLQADENGDRLDEGVEILAQTPGKRLQPLTLLSGGERALTALAFLFALQAVNPSPFYVLDEVDAALDDANVMRFNRVLKRLSREQQFLIVTHNHSTMAQAEVLYGVTLGEHGISRIVSVRMEQDALMPMPAGERTA
jgi:chromosome segregation protein